MSRLRLISMLLITFCSQSVLAQKTETGPVLSYDAQLSGYQYDFPVNYFAIKSQRQTLKMGKLKGSQQIN